MELTSRLPDLAGSQAIKLTLFCLGFGGGGGGGGGGVQIIHRILERRLL